MRRLFLFLNSASLSAQLLRGGMSGIIVRVVSLSASTLASIVLARTLGAAQYGLYAYVFALVSFIAAPVQMGLPTLVVRETAKAEALQNWPLMRGIWTWASVVVIVVSLAMIGLTLLGLFLLRDWMDPIRRSALLWALPLIPLIALGQVRAAAMRGLRHIFLGQLPDEVVRPLLLALCIIGAAYLSADLTANSALAIHSLIAVFTFAVGVTFLMKVRPAAMSSKSTCEMRHADWLSSILPLSMSVGLRALGQYTDIIILGLFRSPSEVGIYRVALSGSTLATFGLTAIELVVQPYIVRLYAEHNLNKMKILGSASAVAALGLSIPVFIIFWWIGQPFISFLFGSGYSASWLPLLILSFGQCVSAFFGSAGHFLLMASYERKCLQARIASSLVGLSLNFILIPYYGVQGAAISSAASTIVWNIIYWYYAIRLLNIDTTPYYFVVRARRIFVRR